MPILEFFCPQTNRIYSFLARNSTEREHLPKCPDGTHYSMQRQLSTFAITGRAKEENEDGWMENMDDSKMDSLLAEMENSGLDENNPDPKQLGGFMKKLRDAFGGKLPPQIDEMIARLDKGEDPDSIENDMGSALDGADFSMKDMKRILHAKRGPTRDPKLYDMRDYLE